MSIDCPVGLPFNIGQYALLLSLIAHVLDYEVCDLIWMGGDCHIYLDQEELVKKQILREPQPLCQIEINPELKDLFAFKASDVKYVNYTYNREDDVDPLKYPVSM